MHHTVWSGFLLTCILPWPAFSQNSEQERFSEVRERLEIEYQGLVAKGFRKEALEVVLPIGRMGSISFQLDLAGGSTYAFVAACDTKCKHVEIVIQDPAGQVAARTMEPSSSGIIIGTTPESGLHTGEVKVVDCSDEQCQAGFSVLRLEGGR